MSWAFASSPGEFDLKDDEKITPCDKTDNKSCDAGRKITV